MSMSDQSIASRAALYPLRPKKSNFYLPNGGSGWRELACGAGGFIGGSGWTMFDADADAPPGEDGLPFIGGNGWNGPVDGGTCELPLAGHDGDWLAVVCGIGNRATGSLLPW